MDSKKRERERERCSIIQSEKYHPDEKKRYEGAFMHLLFTVHPFGLPGEIPGKCSNANYAIRQTVEFLRSQGKLDVEATTVTTCDTGKRRWQCVQS